MPEIPAAGRALGVTESQLAGEVGKGSGEQGTATSSKGAQALGSFCALGCCWISM